MSSCERDCFLSMGSFHAHIVINLPLKDLAEPLAYFRVVIGYQQMKNAVRIIAGADNSVILANSESRSSGRNERHVAGLARRKG